MINAAEVINNPKIPKTIDITGGLLPLIIAIKQQKLIKKQNILNAIFTKLLYIFDHVVQL